MPDELAFTAYTVTSLTAPILGVIMGGAVVHMAGGYTHPDSLRILTWVSLIGTCLAMPLPLVDSYKAYLVLFWLCLFLGGFIMPGLTGIMIHAAPKRYRAIGNSIAFFSYNLLGYVPGPMVYGFISKHTGPTSRIGMMVLVYALIVAFFLLWFSCCGIRKQKDIVNIHQIELEAKDFKESLLEEAKSFEIKKHPTKRSRKG
jgi:MFS family permease